MEAGQQGRGRSEVGVHEMHVLGRMEGGSRVQQGRQGSVRLLEDEEQDPMRR